MTDLLKSRMIAEHGRQLRFHLDGGGTRGTWFRDRFTAEERDAMLAEAESLQREAKRQAGVLDAMKKWQGKK